METIVLVIHLLIAASLVAVVLMQKSEGGALGMGGGGGGGGGFLSGRGTANLLTRTTAGLAAAFFTTSILLTVLAQRDAPETQVLDDLAGGQTAPATAGAATSADKDTVPKALAEEGGILDALEAGKGGERVPAVPKSR